MVEHVTDAESSSEYFVWRAPGFPTIKIRRCAVDGIHNDVMEAMAAASPAGAETGGILLGKYVDGDIYLDDFEPLRSEHTLGPLYLLSAADRRSLTETLLWFRNGGHPTLSVAGLYRSHIRGDFALGDDDERLMRAYFPDPGQVILLIKVSRTEPAVADFFVRSDRRMVGAFRPIPFPFRATPESASLAFAGSESGAAAPVVPEPVVPEPAAAEPAPVESNWPRLPPRPPTRADRELDEEAPSRQRLWTIVAVVLAIIGGVLGYLSVRPDPGEFEPTETADRAPAREAPAAPAPAVPAPVAVTKPSPPVDTSAPRGSADRPSTKAGPENEDRADIHAFLNRWADAIRRGDAQSAASYYAPRVTVYLGRRGVTRRSVQQSIRRSISSFGKLVIHRISDVSIQPAGTNQAVVTFRKHWQTAGYNKYAGEQQERMTLVRDRAGAPWRIASQFEEKVYWIERPDFKPR